MTASLVDLYPDVSGMVYRETSEVQRNRLIQELNTMEFLTH